MNGQTDPRTVISVIVLIVLVAIGVVAYSSVYTLDETEQAVIAQFGELGEPVTEPGLHFKIPFVQEVRRVDKRLLAWDGKANQVLTKGQERIYIDTTARWRIIEPKQFLESLNDETSAQSRLDGIIDNSVRDHISGVALEEIVRSTDWDPTEKSVGPVGPSDDEQGADEAAETEGETNGSGDGDEKEEDQAEDRVPRVLRDRELKAEVELGREKIMNDIEEEASRTIEESGLGIELVDVRLKRINFIDSVRKKVFDRMIAERERVAAEYVSEGKAESAEVLGRMEKELAEIESEAQRQADVIRGEADAKAANIYAEAYGQDRQFYAFYRTLESYSDSLDERVNLIIGADSDYFRYLRSAGAVSDDASAAGDGDASNGRGDASGDAPEEADDTSDSGDAQQ